MTNTDVSQTDHDPGDPRVLSGAIWDELCDTLRGAGRLVLGESAPEAPLLRAEGFRYLLRFLAAGTSLCIEHADPDHPVFTRMVDASMRWGLDCPDCLYLYAAVRGDAAYRIAGRRGGANHVDIQVNYGHFAEGDLQHFGTVAGVNDVELELASDGSFELLLGPDVNQTDIDAKRALRLTPDASFVLVRQYFNDWENEAPADLDIQRLGGPVPVPPLRTDQLAARVDLLRRWLERGGALWEQMSRGFLSLPPNSLRVTLPEQSDSRSGLRGQAYGIGNFQCGRDEAVIVELVPPVCRHWSVSLASYYWESLDFATRQASLNGHQAQLDDDGVFRGVIAHTDPGVSNWLDPAGHERGSIAARFLLADAAPEPVLRRLPLGALRDALPASTPSVSPVERAASLERRRAAIVRRYRR